MAAWRRGIGLAIESDELARLTSIARSRTEPASRVERARMLLAYRESASFFAVGQALGAVVRTLLDEFAESFTTSVPACIPCLRVRHA